MDILASISSGAVGGLLGGIGTLAKDIREAITGKEWTPELQADIQKKAMDMELAATNAQMSMIVAEASSADPLTSRARPMFMYVFYFILLTMGIFVPTAGVWFPTHSAQFYVNVAAGFKAIPDALYTLFGAGYLGYTGARMLEKKAGVAK